MTISSAQCHSVHSAWKGKEFCYRLFKFSAHSKGELCADVF